MNKQQTVYFQKQLEELKKNVARLQSDLRDVLSDVSLKTTKLENDVSKLASFNQAQSVQNDAWNTGVVTVVDNISKQYVVPVDGKLFFNVDTMCLETSFNGKWLTWSPTM